MNCISIRAFT